jgi:hypothetical protein
MANERALLKYRNPDSTQDINDRLAGLLVKGIFEGGSVTVVNGLEISLSGFSTVGSDGMFVKQTNETKFNVASAPDVDIKSYVVIQQQYQVNAEPTVTVEVLTSDLFAVTGPAGEQGADNPNMLVFGTVTVPAGETMLSANNISYLERDAIDVLGRSHFRGLVAEESELPIPGVPSDPAAPADENRTGDYYIVSDGSGGSTVPTFFSWNGSAWVNSTDTTDLQEQLDSHRGNTNESGTELHVSTAQAAALAGFGIDPPSVSNRYLLQDAPLLPTVDQKAALEGNGPDLEDELPSATNPYITSTKVIASPDELAGVLSFSNNPGDGVANWVELGVAENSDGYYVGNGSAGSAQAWFALYAPEISDALAPHQYINEEFESLVIEEIRTGDPGQQPGSFELSPSGDTHVDDLGFFIADGGTGGTLYLKLSNAISVNTARASFGRRSHFGDLGPDLILNRGPQAAQINSVMLRLLTGTPNAQFNNAIWDNIVPGQVAAWNAAGPQFVAADPLNMLPPVGVRGTANNLIQEGMLVLPGAGFPTGSKVYADKANPGSLTINENEWFIGTAITDTILLVNMNGIPLQASGEVTPGVTFPSALFQSVQEGQTVSFEFATGKFVRALTTDPLLLPTGFRGTNNNVIMTGLYVPSSGNPFVTGTKYYADPNTLGFLTTSPNNWYVGVATATNQLLVNLNSVSIPLNFPVEHDDITGRHKFPTGGVGARPSNPATGTIVLRTDLDQNFIEYYNGTFWQTAAEQTFASGTKMLFVQSAIPTGWTLDASMNDRAVIVTDNGGSGPLGGTLNGSWVISGIEDNAVQLEADQLPIHTHLLTTAGWTDNDAGVLNNNGPGISYIDIEVGPFQTDPAAGWGVRDNYGDDGTAPSLEELHQHGVDQDGTWRPYNVAVIVCTKD